MRFTPSNMLQKILLFIFGFALVASRLDPFYRRDYTYVEEFSAFYKVHWDPHGFSWSDAFSACDDEGSLMFYPKLEGEWAVAKDLVSAMTTEPSWNEIFVGLLSRTPIVDDSSRRYTINNKNVYEDDIFSPCVTMEIYNGTFKIQGCPPSSSNVKLFVCKRELVIEACPTVDTDYKYLKEVGRCFKIHNTKAKTWEKANETCYNEGGYLAVIKDYTEADFMEKYLPFGHHYLVGLQRMENDSDSFTIKGNEYNGTFYSYPRNVDQNNTENNCGTVIVKNFVSFRPSKSISIEAVKCDDKYSFLCEMPSKTYTSRDFKSQFSRVSDDRDTVMPERDMNK